MISASRGVIIRDLRDLGATYGIKDLLNIGHPSKYVLNDKIISQFNIRDTFYNVSWNSAANSFKALQLTTLRARAQAERTSIAALPPSQRDKFYWSEDATGAVGPATIVSIDDNNGSPELDHKDPLANRWKSSGKPQPGNNTIQSDRDNDYRDTSNLQVIAKWMNLKKSGEEFDRSVGPLFRGPNDKG